MFNQSADLANHKLLLIILFPDEDDEEVSSLTVGGQAAPRSRGSSPAPRSGEFLSGFLLATTNTITAIITIFPGTTHLTANTLRIQIQFPHPSHFILISFADEN